MIKKLFLLTLILTGQATQANNEELVVSEEPVKVINKANGFQSQVANNPNWVRIMEILRECNHFPYQTVSPITIKTLDHLQFLDPFTGREYPPNWKSIDSKKIASQFPLSNLNVYIETKNIHGGFLPFIAKRYDQELTIDFVKYQDIVIKQYEHYIPSLVGFGFRAKLLINTKNFELDASSITGISSLGALKAGKNSEILTLNVQDLGITSPSLVNQLNQINSAATINEKLKALSNYQAQVQTSITNPDDATIIKPVIFSQKTQCSRSSGRFMN